MIWKLSFPLKLPANTSGLDTTDKFNYMWTLFFCYAQNKNMYEINKAIKRFNDLITINTEKDLAKIINNQNIIDVFSKNNSYIVLK